MTALSFSRLAAVPAALLSLAACDYSGDWLFANPTDVPGIIDLGTLEPVAIDSQDDIDAAVIYGEVGATGTSERGGITFSFVGTGSAVCLWVDPEVAFWNQSVGELQPIEEYAYPDNVYDDGDIDLFAGFSVYYTGSPGEEVGDFKILYEDPLGNKVPIELNECTIAGLNEATGGHAGRGAPEFCTLQSTQPGVSYTVLLETFSTPLDDDRLGYGLLLVDGTCRSIQQTSDFTDECVVRGETIDPATAVYDEAGRMTEGDAVEGSILFEEAFCNAGSGELLDFCIGEADQKACEDGERCFCGDPDASPTGGTF